MINWKNIAERALWTFLEAFLVALPATIKLDIPGAEWTSILMGAAAAGISAVKTLIVDYIHAMRANKTEPPE